MGCPNNPKVFIVFAYDGECEYSDVSVEKSGTVGEFHVVQKCKNCQSPRRLLFIKQQELMKIGYNGDKLSDLREFKSKLSGELK